MHYVSGIALLELLTHLTSQLAPLYVPRYPLCCLPVDFILYLIIYIWVTFIHYFVSLIQSRFAWLKSLLFTGKTESREVIAKILGIVAQYLPADQQVEATKVIISDSSFFLFILYFFDVFQYFLFYFCRALFSKSQTPV